jgi:DNA-damage-inducible protein J
MTQINIRIDDSIKKQADKLFDDLGMNMTTALTVFIKAAIRHRGIPFELTVDPFYSENNKRTLEESFHNPGDERLTEQEPV